MPLPPMARFQDQTVATPAHRCSVELPPAAARALRVTSIAAVGASKKEAERLCALKVGLGRIAALHHRSSTSYRNR
jgi:hypothetical protein